MTGRDHAGVFVPPPLIFVAPLVISMLLDARAAWPITVEHESFLLIAGFVFLAAGISLGIAGVATFRAANTTILPAGRATTAVVERGPYRFSRNPMYVAMALGYIGVAFLINNGWALVLLLFAILVIDVFVIRREERYLAEKFGDGYLAYLRRVRRWL
jgi:protein-S-isoprenylcysteine O-methyltransferase Ste14